MSEITIRRKMSIEDLAFASTAVVGLASALVVGSFAFTKSSLDMASMQKENIPLRETQTQYTGKKPEPSYKLSIGPLELDFYFP